MPKRILIAEDDSAIADMLQMMLEGEGYDVATQINGEEVRLLQEPFPDLLLLDLRLSGTDGRTICRQLKSQEATRHIPIIILSANKDTQRIAREAGADGFLAKPFEMSTLLALVATHLGRE